MHSVRVCASLDTSKGKILLSSGGVRTEIADRQRALVAELVRLKVDVIVTSGGGPTRAVKDETVTIPIVFAQDTDPIGNGFVASLARPGGNITGLSRLAPELTGKQVELLKEVVPRLSRVAVFATLTSPSYAQALKETELAAGALKVMLQYLDVQGPKDFETAFREASKGRADAVLWVVSGNIASPHRKTIAELAIRSRLPAIYEQATFVEAGWPDVLWRELYRLGSTRGYLCRQNFKRYKASRSARGTADEV